MPWHIDDGTVHQSRSTVQSNRNLEKMLFSLCQCWNEYIFGQHVEDDSGPTHLPGIYLVCVSTRGNKNIAKCSEAATDIWSRSGHDAFFQRENVMSTTVQRCPHEATWAAAVTVGKVTLRSHAGHFCLCVFVDYSDKIFYKNVSFSRSYTISGIYTLMVGKHALRKTA